MDCSETYIKMSVQAWPDLQPLINEDMIDWRHQGYCTEHNCLAREGYDGCAECPKWQEEYDSLSLDYKAQDAMLEVDKNCQPPLGTKWIPLLHQDQLQAMCQPVAIDELIRRFFGWYHDWYMRVDTLTACHTSMEQLWLLFVMREKFSKIWTRFSWV